MSIGTKVVKTTESYWKKLGPGFTTGASDDDPSGIATYSQIGAKYGFNFLWLSIYTFPLMIVVQEMCARIGLVTGRGLAANIRLYYPKWVLYLCTMLLLGANSFNIGADIGAMAKTIQLLAPGLSFTLLVISIAVISLGLQIFTTYESYSKYLKYLALFLLAYIFSALLVDLDWSLILSRTFIPTFNFSKEQFILIAAVLGTTISPYLFFWQTSQEVEEEILEGKSNINQRVGASDNDLKSMRIDVVSGMFLSNLVMYFIIAASAATLFSSGITNISTVAEAAQALKPIGGQYSSLLFALGVVGTGMLAIPVLAGSASYAIAESFKQKTGLYRKFSQARFFYGVIIFATILGVLMNFLGIDPINALIFSAVTNAVVAPIVLITIVHLSSSKKVMGNRANNTLGKLMGWGVTGVMAIVGIGAIASIVI